MLYVMFGVGIALAMVCGVQASMICNLKMKHRAEVGELRCANYEMEKKMLRLTEKMEKLSGVWEGIER